MSKQDPFWNFTPEKWAKIKSILSGDDDQEVSLKAAATAAGVNPSDIRRWKMHSISASPDADPLIAEIAPFLDSIKELQAGRLIDVAWNRAIKGVDEPMLFKGEVVSHKTKYDNNLLMKLLKARDPDYVDRPKVEINFNPDDIDEIFQRLQSGRNYAKTIEEAKRLEEKTIDATANDEDVFEVK